MTSAALPGTPLQLLKVVVERLHEAGYPFALAGGLAASLYRAEPRVTKDVDIALAVGNDGDSKEAAIALLRELGLEPALGWISYRHNELTDPIALVIGRRDKNDLESTVDFLLPTFPWVKKAVLRAQHNLIDFGFDKLPTMTPEDVIIAKCFALSLEPNRFKDLDDLSSIFKNENALDLVYLTNELKRLGISIPTAILPLAPVALVRAAKQLRQKVRKE